jgi:hypothetical protein
MKCSLLLVTLLLIAGPTLAAPDDLQDAFQKLKDAESKKDPVLVKTLAVETCAVARKEAATPAPEDAADKDAWTKRVAYAREIELHSEYALFAAAVPATPALAVDLISTLEQQNPKSKYLDEAYARYFLALSQTGASAKIPAIAEKALVNFPENEDLLLVLADASMTRKQTDRTLAYAERVVSVLERHPKPEGYSAADWDRKRTAALSRARWMAGVMHAEKSQYYEADRDLRAALPLIQGSPGMLAPALFHLGVANYQLGKTMMNKQRVLEAAKFSEQAGAIKGPLAEQAWRNAHIMKTEAGKMR